MRRLKNPLNVTQIIMGTTSAIPLYVRIFSPLLETGVEDLGLIFWLGFQMSGDIPAAVITLFVLLLAEHILSQTFFTGLRATRAQLLEIGLFSLLEVGIWVVWLMLLSVNVLVAGMFFVGSLYVEHQITYNVKKGLGFFNFRNSRPIIYIGILVFTLFEVGGAGLWVMLVSMGQPLVGLIALVLGSLIEHTIAGAVARV